MLPTRVSEIMTKNAIHIVGTSNCIREVARRMKEANRGCLLVVENGRLVGIVTERDLVQRVIAEGKSPNCEVSEIMSKPVITVGPDALITDATEIMIKNKIRRLVVTEGNSLVGIVTTTDFAKVTKGGIVSDPILSGILSSLLSRVTITVANDASVRVRTNKS